MDFEEKITASLIAMSANMNEDLQKLIQYPSVIGKAAVDAPFGKDIATALNYILAKAESWGFKTKNLQGYAAVADLGDFPEQIGAISHIDVVPAGEGWRHNPFGGAIENGRLFGRGAIDDKGPLIACFYAMRAIKESKAPLSKTIRHIIGTDEESGFRCMDYYLRHEAPPLMGFVPDGEFPLIYAEKGIIHFSAVPLKAPPGGGEVEILEMAGGTASNVIPCAAYAHLKCSPDICAQAENILADYPSREYLSIYPEESGMHLNAKGLSAHGSLPFAGINAISVLIGFIKRLPFNAALRRDLLALNDLFCREWEGIGLGINLKDESGALTLAPTILRWDGQKGIEIEADIRFPVSYSAEIIKEKITRRLDRNGFSIASWKAMKPHQVDKNHPLILTLLEQYRKFSGDNSPPVSMGGGTYARAFENFVAFGPLMPGQESTAHQADEYIDLKWLLTLAKIYAHSLYHLAKA
jgi:succinyl-diaminopimelate desuccinylase